MPTRIIQSEPLVSCLCLTNDRRAYLPLAISCYKRQSYSNRELVIIDNGVAPDEDLCPAGTRYFRVPPGIYNHGELMNLGSEKCQGELIATWDSDDYYADDRLADQVSMLTSDLKYCVCGYDTTLFLDTDTNKAYRYSYRGRRSYALGTSQMFYKSFWDTHRFPPVYKGADTVFCSAAEKEGVLITSRGLDKMVVRAHKDSTSPPTFTSSSYEEVDLEALPEGFTLR